MTQQRSWLVQLIRAAVRDWWLVAACVVIAAGVAVGLNWSKPTTYKASAAISADSVTIASNPRLAKPDTVVAESRKGDFREELAAETGLDLSEIRSGLNAFSSGNPQNKVTVTFTHEDKGVAASVAKAAATRLQARTLTLNEGELERQRALLEESRKALEVIDSSQDPASLATGRWSISRSIITDELNIEAIEGCYTYGGSTSVKASLRRTRVMNAGIAGVLLGLVAGLVLVAGRDYSRRRAEDAST